MVAWGIRGGNVERPGNAFPGLSEQPTNQFLNSVSGNAAGGFVANPHQSVSTAGRALRFVPDVKRVAEQIAIRRGIGRHFLVLYRPGMLGPVDLPQIFDVAASRIRS